MTHKLIHTPDYLLVVDDSQIKEGDYCILLDSLGNLFLGGLPTQYLGEENGHYLNKGLRKVIAHLPLNDSPILEGVDLLPPLEQEDDVEKLAQSAFTHPDFGKYKVGSIAYYNGYKEGYNKAKDRYKYTEEDVKITIQQAFLSGVERLEDFEKVEKMILENIQSLSQPKMPIGFECEIEYFYMASKVFYQDADWVKCDKVQYESIRKEIPTCPLKKVHKEISTPEGHTQWVGKYIY